MREVSLPHIGPLNDHLKTKEWYTSHMLPKERAKYLVENLEPFEEVIEVDYDTYDSLQTNTLMYVEYAVIRAFCGK